MLSVGYNNDGQDFFDTLVMYRDYIHSYFFSLTSTVGCYELDTESVIEKLLNCNTYRIPGNLLLNYKYDWNRYKELIESVRESHINLRAVTVLNIDEAARIKSEYPDLEVHLSVRFWDYERHLNPRELFKYTKDQMREWVDVVNLSDVRSFNDFQLANDIRSLGCKTKFIVNEGCIINRSNNYSKFPGFESLSCHGAPCYVYCHELTTKYQWAALSRALFYKEFIPVWGHQYDILKLSTRYISTDEIFKILQYWTSDDDTRQIICNGILINISDRDVYMEWINERSKCKGNCWECRKCESIFSRIGDHIQIT